MLCATHPAPAGSSSVLAPAGRGLSSLRSQASTALYVLLAMMVILLLIASFLPW